ncbi:MAG: ABC transporter permease subunit, partial [Bacilli bacterium]|nr:ABC transporter permease subunit [Bacilli bacterium]
YATKQSVENANLYEKFNVYYKTNVDYTNRIRFFEHYEELVSKYDSLKDKYAEVNEANLRRKQELVVECDQKIKAINAKFDAIVERKNSLVVELKSLTNAKNAEIKAAGKNPAVVNEIEDRYFVKISKLAADLHKLPEDKAIAAMRKEEIKEVKHACDRDRKYLKTNFTSETYCVEEVINTMLLDYKFEYSFAKEMVNEIVVKEGKEVRHLTSAEVEEKLSALREALAKYNEEHQDKFVGKPKSFKEQMNGLLNENFHVSILLLPILGIILFTIVPLVFSILIAFTNYSSGHQPPNQLFTWYGFENFITLFAAPADSVYAMLPSALVKTLGWTICWTIIATFSNYFLGIILALLINKKSIKFKKLWRTIFIMTIAVPQFISLMSIGVLLKDVGAVGTWWANTFGSRLGFGTDPTNGAIISKIIIIIVNIWIGIPYTMLSTTGILMNIPNDLYESATVDGAGPFTQFTKITLPYILFVTGSYLITQFIGNINNFNVIFFLTGGGPNISGTALQVGHTDLLITFIYKMVTSNNNPQFGIASTIGIVIFVVCAFFSIIMYNKSSSVQAEDQFQ